MASREESNEEKAEAEAMLEVAKSHVVVDDNNVKNNNDPVVFVMLSNRRWRIIKLTATKSWTADFIEKPAGSINIQQQSIFSHRGSKGAVIYAEQGATNPVGYLVAWAAAGRFATRVYVDCGPLPEIYYNGWEAAALTKIDAASRRSSAMHHPTSSAAQATIQDESGTFVMGVARVNVG